MAKVKDTRYFLIEDLDCITKVEYDTRKSLLGYLEYYIDNFVNDWFNPSDESFSILYDDGTEDYVDDCYDGHKVRKQHIKSIVYNNPESSMVFGNFEINEYGVVTISDNKDIIAEENIKEVNKEYLYKVS